MDDLDVREILVRKPFTRVMPNGYCSNDRVTDNIDNYREYEDKLMYQIVTQADFLREYDPRGHAINNPLIYPDIIKKDPESKRFYKEEVVRCSFAFQRVITTKHIIHLCGNDIQFELPDMKDDEENKEMMLRFHEGWLEKNMEIRMYEAIKSLKITGDTAIVGYFDNGKFGTKVLSYLEGDTLYPHFDSLTGELTLFARKYYDYDEKGNQKIEWVEVWDEKYLYRYKRDIDAERKKKSLFDYIKGIFGLSGYSQVSIKRHGFSFVPVAYHRDDNGACWSNSQDCIDKYELAFSQLSQNNQAYAFPIMYLKGDDVELIGDMDGAVKVVTMGQDDDAGFLQKQDASASFATQLEKLYKMIYELSFAVIPPELKSGDLPGVAVKLLYSPAYENAMRDAQELNPFLDNVVKIFKFGYGTEVNQVLTYMTFEVYAWIEPYYHKSVAEIAQNLATAVQNGFLSKQTASERLPDYPKNGEWDRIMREDVERREQDLKYEIDRQQQQMEIDVEKAKKTSSFSGKVSTGQGRNRTTDENGNHPGENNWDNWNAAH